VLHGPQHYCSVGSGDSNILYVEVDGAGSKSCVTDVTGCSIKIGSENTKNGRVLCGTCHSHQPLADVEWAESKLLAEVMAEQCTEAKLADQFQASAIGLFSSNGVFRWNIPAVLSRGDVHLNLCDLDTGQAKSTSCDLDTGQAKSSFQGASCASSVLVLVQVRSNVEHDRVVECAQHSHFKSDGTGRACEISMGAVEILQSTKSASN
jgi:hypothetical protein